MRVRRWCVGWLTASVSLVAAGFAQSPDLPRLQTVSPAGGARGSSVEITLSGGDLSEPLVIGTTFPARVTTPTDDARGKDSMKIRRRLELTPEVTIGWHQIRVLTSKGLSSFRPFCVDALPQIESQGRSRSPASAQAVSPPCVVVGRIQADASEFFRFPASAGQRLSFEVLGRRLGSAVDPWIKLYDAKSGHELPLAYCDDAPGLQTDPRLTHTFPAAGEYLIEVRDSTWRGGPDFAYRLRIGDFPCAIAPLPLAITRGRKVSVGFAGPAVDRIAPVEIQVPTDPAIDAINVIPVGPSGLPGWPVAVLVSDFEEILAPDPMPKDGLRVAVPTGITGRFLHKSQVDTVRFPAHKGRKYIVAVQTNELLSPAEVYVTVRDPKGAVIAKSEPEKPARHEFVAAEDGDYVVTAEQTNYAFGPNEVYRLTIAQPTAGFDLTLGSDRVDLPQGQASLIPVQSLARRDFGGPIELIVVGQPGLSGSLAVAPGAESGPPPGPGQPAGAPFAMLPIRAAPELKPGVYHVQVQAKAIHNGQSILSFAGTRSLITQAMGGLPFPPRTWLRDVAVGVLPKPPVQLAARFVPPEAVRGLTTKLIVTAQRDAGFDGPIALSLTGLPVNVTAKPLTIEAGATEAGLTLELHEQAALGSYAFTLVGRTTVHDMATIATFVPPPLTVVRAFELRTEPNSVTIEQGDKAQLTVSATRKGGFDGPIKLELRNLPAQVTAPKERVIEKGQTSTVIELAAAATAPLAARGDVDVLGTIKLAQQQSASPPFAIKVQAPAPVLNLKLEPVAVSLKPGGKANVKVSVERKHLAGPAAISISGLPAKASANTIAIPAEKSDGELELSAAADAPPGQTDATITAKTGTVTVTAKMNVRIEKATDK